MVWKRLAYFLCFENRASGDLFSRYDLQDATDAFGGCVLIVGGILRYFGIQRTSESLSELQDDALT